MAAAFDAQQHIATTIWLFVTQLSAVLIQQSHPHQAELDQNFIGVLTKFRRAPP